MLVRESIGNVISYDLEGFEIDVLELEWYEMTKRIQRKVTKGGMEVAIKFLREGQRLTEGDIIYIDDKKAVVVRIIPTDAIVVAPKSMNEMGTLCYEIGNKHMPIFLQNNEILMPFEEPMFRWLVASGFNPIKEVRTLHNLLKSNVEVHGHGSGSSSSLFTKIIDFASKV